MAALIEVLEGGAATSVQDAGRPGSRRYGVALSGALDPIALACANALAGNPLGAAALELRLTGPRLRVRSGCVRAALAGAALAEVHPADAPARPLAAWRTITLARGDELRIGRVRDGTAYLALSGGIDIPPVLGSRATHARAALGGLAGRTLRAGDALPIGDAAAPAGPESMQCAFFHDSGPLRVLAGPQDAHFTPQALRTLAEAEFCITHDADRMGLRLRGPRLDHHPTLGDEIISDGVAPGAIQVPPDGQPILLLADCQTVGGYPKIATVIRADLPRLAQRLPGDRLRFAFVMRAEAVAALRAQRERLNAWIAAIAACAGADFLDEAALYNTNLISGAVFSEESRCEPST